MHRPLRNLIVAVSLISASVLSWADDGAGTAASSASGVGVRVEGAVKRGASAAEYGIKRGVGAAEYGVKTAASAVAHGASVAGNAIDRTARRIGLPASGASSAR